MGKHLRAVLFAALALSLLAALPVIAQAKTTFTTSKPVLSDTSTMGKDFSVSGVITPASTAKSRATVKVRLLREMDGQFTTSWTSTRPSSPRCRAGKKGTKYSRTLNIPMTGKHAVQAFQYRGGKARLQVADHVLRRADGRPAGHHRLDGQWVDGAVARGHHGPRGHAAGHRLHHPVRLGLRRPGEALRRGALHVGRLREGRRRRADLAHRRAASRPLRLDARRDAQVGHRLAGRRPADRHRQDLTRRHSRAAVPAGATSPSATSAPRAWAATAASRSSRASSRRRAPTRSSGTPTAWSPHATTGSAGWTTATTGRWSPMVLPSRCPSIRTPWTR